MTLAAILGALLALAPGFSFAAGNTAQVADMNSATDRFHDAVRDHHLSHEEVSDRAFDFSNKGIPAVEVGLRFKKYHWHEFAAPDASKTGSVESIMTAGKSALSRTIKVPEPEVGEDAGRADEMFGQGKLRFGALEPNEAGEYRYTTGSRELGHIELTDFMKTMSMLVAQELLYATVIHEARHANDHQRGDLSPQQVKKGEISAFKSQYEYLAATTHNGEEIATNWQRLNALFERTKNPIIKRAADYVFSLVALIRTRGEEERLKEYVDIMGYEEGRSPKTAAAPTSS